MARLIPHENPNAIQLEPERRVAAALCSQFGDDALVFHSYPWFRPERSYIQWGGKEVLREGEADFVLVDPRFGIMVIEVKGGDVFYSPETSQWGRHGGNHPVKDPFRQAERNLHAIEAHLRARSFGPYPELPFSRARCVVFPHSDFVGHLPPGADRRMLFGASDLPLIRRRIEALFRMQPFVPAAALNRTVIDGIRQGLTSNFRLVPALSTMIEEQERRIVRLTENQSQILMALSEHPRACIKGVAGSGKTLLAITKAKMFADEGKRVLFVCFNELLAEWLRSQLPESYSRQLTITNYHKLCRDWTLRAGLQWPSGANQAELFQVQAPGLLERAIDLLDDQRFDAVVVDEGQDFMSAWWDTLLLINKDLDEGPFYVFHDPVSPVTSKCTTCGHFRVHHFGGGVFY